MSKFKFGMQKILDLKEKKREQEEWNFAKLARLIDEENKRLKELISYKDQLHQELFSSQTTGVSIIELNQSQSYIEHLNQVINIHIQKMNQLQDSLLKKREELIEVKIDEKKFHKLREKKWKEYINENNHFEQRELDEMANHLMYK